jgi:hypothetical protein
MSRDGSMSIGFSQKISVPEFAKKNRKKRRL